MSEEEIDISDFTKLDGVGPAFKAELRSGKYDTIIEIAAAIPSELKERCKITEDKAIKAIEAANKYLEETNLLDSYVMDGLQDLMRRESLEHIKLGSENLNGLLNGGIEVGATTEFYGEFGSGKSQISMMAALQCPQSKENGGLDGAVIYYDTEGTFRPERIKHICEARGYDWENTLKKIIRVKAYTSSILTLEIEKKLAKRIQETGARLVIIDSVISLLRAEKIGRGQLADRQQKLGELLHILGRTIETYKCACILTNQVQSKVDGFLMPGMDPNKPTGGNVMGHASTYRISLRKSGKKKTATMVDSPDKDWETVPFYVTKKGLSDEEESGKGAKKSEEDQE